MLYKFNAIASFPVAFFWFKIDRKEAVLIGANSCHSLVEVDHL